jgi:hypothetical protein
LSSKASINSRTTAIALASELPIKTCTFIGDYRGFSIDPLMIHQKTSQASARLRNGAHTTIAQAVLAQRQHLQKASGRWPATKASGQGHCTIKAQEITSMIGWAKAACFQILRMQPV